MGSVTALAGIRFEVTGKRSAQGLAGPCQRIQSYRYYGFYER